MNATANGGGQEIEGLRVAPYVAILLNDFLSADAAAGYTSLSTDQSRIDPRNAATLTSSFDADRWFATANLNAFHAYDNGISIGATVGVLYANET